MYWPSTAEVRVYAHKCVSTPVHPRAHTECPDPGVTQPHGQSPSAPLSEALTMQLIRHQDEFKTEIMFSCHNCHLYRLEGVEITEEYTQSQACRYPSIWNLHKWLQDYKHLSKRSSAYQNSRVSYSSSIAHTKNTRTFWTTLKHKSNDYFTGVRSFPQKEFVVSCARKRANSYQHVHGKSFFGASLKNWVL